MRKNRLTETFEMKLRNFVRESNRIEGIDEVRPGEVEVLQNFLGVDKPRVADIVNLVHVFEPTARLRNLHGMDVQVGGYVPPFGGPEIPQMLDNLLSDLDHKSAWEIHCDYESLHPFTDGNGRSGRALWLWKRLIEPGKGMVFHYGFLQCFYYDTLKYRDKK